MDFNDDVLVGKYYSGQRTYFRIIITRLCDDLYQVTRLSTGASLLVNKLL